MKTSSDNIRTWVPVSFIKGKDGNGKETTKMKIGGLASTSSQDEDGEYLDPNGFDLSYLLESGFLNWNHQATKDPSAIIGKPTKAEITEKGLEIEGDLFNTPKAKQVYELGEVLEKEGIPLGFSIEGKATQRGSLDPEDPEYKKVLKARITGIAITPNPKNVDSVMTIIKGHNYDQLSAYEDASQEEIDKALSVESTSGQALAKESLDGATKEVEKQKPTDEESEKYLSKSQVVTRLMDRYPSVSINTIERMYTSIKKNHSVMVTEEKEVVAVSDEAMNKALDTLDQLQKGAQSFKMNDDSDEDEEEESDDKKNKVKKAKESNDNDEEEEESDDMSKGFTPSAEQIEAAETILKSVGFEVLSPEQAELKKGIDSDLGTKNDDLGNFSLVKGIITDLHKKFAASTEASTVLIKGMMTKIEDLQSNYTQLLEANPGHRSITGAAGIERFDKSNNLQKGNEGVKNILSVSRNRQQVLDLIESKVWNEDQSQVINKGLATDLGVFESSGQLTKAIIEVVQKEGFTLIN